MTTSTTTTKINITLDSQPMLVESGVTIMEAAELHGIRIPRLCYHPDLSLAGACRVCIVEVEGFNYFLASCSVKVWDGMVIRTNSPEIRQARRDIVELLLDNHTKDCQTCERNGNCELQRLAEMLGIRDRLFEGRRKDLPADETGVSVVREPNKCILCGRCVRVCSEVQGVHNLGRHGRGFTSFVSPAHKLNMDDSVCIQCGQCINACPTAALLEKDDTEKVWRALADSKKHVVVQTAPSIRAAIGEGFGLKPGTPSTGKMIWALRQLGFNAVFDTNFGADLTIMEESNEFLDRVKAGGPLPMITSCSPGWISFLERFYPEMVAHASTCRSPMSMTSVLTKTYYAEKRGLDPADVFVVAVMPCVAKKFEAGRPEHAMENGTPYTDAVLTTRELIRMIKSWGIDYWTMPDLEFWSMPNETFDDPLGESTGAADIFGATGGVMEATLRTAAAKLGVAQPGKIDYEAVRHTGGLKEATIPLGDLKINVAVANGLVNAKQVLESVLSGEKTYHIIEIMACPGGCIGGGGQPYPPPNMRIHDPELLRLRTQALYTIDAQKQKRCSHENESIQKLYKEFLGEPGSDVAHKLLHTHYHTRLPRGIK